MGGKALVSIHEDARLAFTPVHKLRELIERNEISPVELLDTIFRRIDRINPKLNAYITLAQDEAYRTAREAEKAVAASISPLSLGSDGGGSIRQPASFSGIVGMKPTNGRVPQDVKDWGVSHVACLGPMTRDVRDAAMMLNVIAGPDKADYTCIRKQPPDFFRALENKGRPLRIAYSYNLDYDEINVDLEVMNAFKDAVKTFENLGHKLEEAAPKIKPPSDLWMHYTGTRRFVAWGHVLTKYPNEITDYAKRGLELALNSTGIEVAKSWVEVEKMRGILHDFFDKYDLLLTPTTVIPAFKIGYRQAAPGKAQYSLSSVSLTIFANWSGNPAISIPCGFFSDGLPIGLQIIGRLEDEVTVLQASAAFEQAQPWADKYPPIS
jgi:aspartyl-tRNA(Asn)/glutamyl-tRNA(Gln) amidotransferase subunit A